MSFHNDRLFKAYREDLDVMIKRSGNTVKVSMKDNLKGKVIKDIVMDNGGVVELKMKWDEESTELDY